MFGLKSGRLDGDPFCCRKNGQPGCLATIFIVVLLFVIFTYLKSWMCGE